VIVTETPIMGSPLPPKIPTHRVNVPASPQKDRRRRRGLVFGARWQHIRARVLARHPECGTPGCHRLATCVDHRDNDSANNSEDNLVALCKPCHSRKTVQRDGGFGRPKAVDDA
jgi:5-methylcytosine-specific restriction enzyme A